MAEEDTRDFVEQAQSVARDFHGRELSADELATDFARLDIGARSDALQRMRAKDGTKAEGNEKVYATAADAARDYTIRSALVGMHERLRRAGR